MFCIDANPSSEKDLKDDDADCHFPKYRPSVENEDDDSSDCEIPQFSIPAFQKYVTGTSDSSKQVKRFHKESIKLSSSLNAGEKYNKSNYINMSAEVESMKNQLQQKREDLKKKLNETSKKSVVCQPGFENLEKVPTFTTRKQSRKEGLKERDKTKGFHWYGMAAPEMTEEKKNDLMVVQMRKALDPKHFYKRSATKTTPKYFQVGTFVENPVEFYSSRIPKKQRKQTLVDELLADAEFRQYQKKKYAEIQGAQPPKFIRRKRLTHSRRVEARAVQFSKNTKKGKKKH